MKVLVTILFCFAVVGCDKPQEAPVPATTGDKPVLPATADPVELELAHQHSPYHGLVTAGQPTEAQFDQLQAAGYSAVINLRTDNEPGYWDEKEKATRNTLLYAHIPIGGPDDLTRENVEKFAQTIEQPMAKKGKILLHCGSSNRAGAMVALKAHWIDGRSVEDSMELGRKAGLESLEDPVLDAIKAAADKAD